MVTEIGHRIGYCGALATRALRRAVAFAREELEDVYAEAQEIRRAEAEQHHLGQPAEEAKDASPAHEGGKPDSPSAG